MKQSNEVLAAFQAGDLARADALARAALAVDPADWRALHMLGAIALRSGRYDDAVADFERTLALAPDYAAARANLVVALRRAGREEAAIAAFARIAPAERPPELTVEYASALVASRRLDEAETALRGVLMAHSDLAAAHYVRGRIDEARGDRAAAIAGYRRASALAPDDAMAHAALGAALCDDGRVDEAMACLRRSVALRPTGLAVWKIAEALVLQGRLAEAETALWEGFGPARDPRFVVDSDRALARGDRPAAIAAFLAALRALPPRPPRFRRGGSPRVDRIAVQSTLPTRTLDFESIATLTGLPAVSAESTPPASEGRTLLLFVSAIEVDHADRIRALARRWPDAISVAWLFDNHHRFLWNYETAAAADIAFPLHSADIDYFSIAGLDVAGGHLGPHVPSCLAQWTERQLRRYYADAQGAPRSHRLHGHMAFYPVATRRNRLAHEVARSMPDSDVRLTFGRAYHELGARERFERWRAFKTSLHLPVLGDLSMRVFDALAAGHVPIVPADTRDLDKAIPPAEQRRLPIVRLSEYTVAAVRAAHAEALAAFDAGGEAQAALRHRYVLENHMLGHRVRDIVRHVEAWMTQGASARAW